MFVTFEIAIEKDLELSPISAWLMECDDIFMVHLCETPLNLDVIDEDMTSVYTFLIDWS